MALDVNLVLDNGQTVVADLNTPYIECEGGGLAWVRLWTAAMTGAASTCDIRVMFSRDVGSNYYMAGKFQQLGPTNDNAYMVIPVYLPRPAIGTNKLRVRLAYDVAGAAPSYTITKCVIDPMTSLAPPATDDDLGQGAVCLIAAV